MRTRDNQIRSVAKPTPNARLQKMGPAGELKRVTGQHQRIPDIVMRALAELDTGFADFVADQFAQRGTDDPDLTRRERGLCCLATDMLNQTLDESSALHV